MLGDNFKNIYTWKGIITYTDRKKGKEDNDECEFTFQRYQQTSSPCHQVVADQVVACYLDYLHLANNLDVACNGKLAVQLYHKRWVLGILTWDHIAGVEESVDQVGVIDKMLEDSCIQDSCCCQLGHKQKAVDIQVH